MGEPCLTLCLSLCLCVCVHRLSGQNMLVPVGVHFLYDFSALFFTWLVASRDASQRVQRAEQIMRANSGAAICMYLHTYIHTYIHTCLLH